MAGKHDLEGLSKVTALEGGPVCIAHVEHQDDFLRELVTQLNSCPE